MSDDLRERVAALADKITHAMDQGVEDGYVEEMIAMFKQDAVEAIEDKLRFGSTNCCQNLLKTLKEL